MELWHRLSSVWCCDNKRFLVRCWDIKHVVWSCYNCPWTPASSKILTSSWSHSIPAVVDFPIMFSTYNTILQVKSVCLSWLADQVCSLTFLHFNNFLQCQHFKLDGSTIRITEYQWDAKRDVWSQAGRLVSFLGWRSHVDAGMRGMPVQCSPSADWAGSVTAV